MNIRVLLVDSHDLVREGLRSLLSKDPAMEVIGEASDGVSAVRLARSLRPDIVITEVSLPLMNGFMLIRAVTNDLPGTRTLALSAFSDWTSVNRATEAGAIGYLLKTGSSAELVQAIYEAMHGRAFFPPSISKRLLDHYREAYLSGQPLKPLRELTERELQVLQLIAEGLVNKQIAATLGLSAKTIEKHRQSVMKKTKHRDIASLTRYAIQTGVIRVDLPA